MKVRRYRGTISVSLLLVWLSFSLSAWAVPADEGYEADVLPANVGWVEHGSGFLGDYVTVTEGIMTYDGTVNPALGTSGMTPAEVPRLGNEGTVEYRFRCRAIGGKKGKWHQYFISVAFGGKVYSVSDNVGHRHDFSEQEIVTYCTKPEESLGQKPLTSNGRWAANEWVTIRHIIRGSGEGKYRLESWITGPAGEKKYVDTTKEYAGTPPSFWLRVNSNTCKGAIFDLDYIRWSSQAVPHGIPLEAAIRAPSVGSIHPRDGVHPMEDKAWAEYGRAAFGLMPSEHTLDFAKAQFISVMNCTDEYVWLWYYESLFPANNIPTLGG